jgi:methionyl-tRNA formyltransferase
MDVLFLGQNNVGQQVYDWLCDRESVSVLGMITRGDHLELVHETEPDILVASGFRAIIPPEVLSVPTEGCVNLHPGYLPLARGMYPNIWSIVEDTRAGVTLHYMDEGIDTGDIIARERVETSFDDSGRDLYERLEDAGFTVFVQTWPAIEAGDVSTETQSTEDGSYHTSEHFDDLCEIDPNETYTAKQLLDVLRALTFPPFNNAFVEIDNHRYYIEVDITRESAVTEYETYGAVGSYDGS